jgi:hypothetical protein
VVVEPPPEGTVPFAGVTALAVCPVGAWAIGSPTMLVLAVLDDVDEAAALSTTITTVEAGALAGPVVAGVHGSPPGSASSVLDGSTVHATGWPSHTSPPTLSPNSRCHSMKPPPNTMAPAASHPAPDTRRTVWRAHRPGSGDAPMTRRIGTATPDGAGTSGTSRSQLLDSVTIAMTPFLW